jgi:hypothetical protein
MIALTLVALEGTLAIARLPADAPIPGWARGGPFLSITRTADELSVVCREDQVPPDVKSERGWRCLQVVGPLEFSAVGILAALVDPLAGAGIPVFVVSTFDTDSLLIPGRDFDRAVGVLRDAGHKIAR